MASGIVKYRLVDFLEEIPDKFAPQGVRPVIRYATHGQTVTTEPRPAEGADPNTVYNCPQESFDRFVELDAVFSDAEIQAMEQGLTAFAPAESSDSLRAGGLGTTTPWADTSEGIRHPIAFDELTPLALADHFNRTGMSDDEIVAIVEENPTMHNRVAAALAARSAAAAVLPDAISPELAERLAEAGGTVARAPEQSDDESGGIPGTDEPESGSQGAATARRSARKRGGASADEDGDAEGYTTAAKQLADEWGIDIADVEGTGADGKVTKADVENHTKAQQIS